MNHLSTCTCGHIYPYSGGHKAMQHETRNWNNFDECEPEQQYRLGTVSYKITGGGGLKPAHRGPTDVFL